MRTWRRQVRAELTIDASIERVFDVATDPQLVPRYADEIARIDILERPNDEEALVRSLLKLGPLRLPFRYRYLYRRPRQYAGFQIRRGLLRGYFVFSFRAHGKQTVVVHAEGIESRVPVLARIVGFMYFQLLGRGDLRPELARLAELVTEDHR